MTGYWINKVANFCKKPFLRITALRVFEEVAVAVLFLGRDLRGVEYGGGPLARAASQSNGIEDDIEGVSAGDLCIPKESLCFGVLVGASGLLGEAAAALFSCASRRRAMEHDEDNRTRDWIGSQTPK
jgi:hypothetical protein